MVDGQATNIAVTPAVVPHGLRATVDVTEPQTEHCGSFQIPELLSSDQETLKQHLDIQAATAPGLTLLAFDVELIPRLVCVAAVSITAVRALPANTIHTPDPTLLCILLARMSCFPAGDPPKALHLLNFGLGVVLPGLTPHATLAAGILPALACTCVELIPRLVDAALRTLTSGIICSVLSRSGHSSYTRKPPGG